MKYVASFSIEVDSSDRGAIELAELAEWNLLKEYRKDEILSALSRAFMGYQISNLNISVEEKRG